MLRFTHSSHSPPISLASFHVSFPLNSAAFTCKQRNSLCFPLLRYIKKSSRQTHFFRVLPGQLSRFYNTIFILVAMSVQNFKDKFFQQFTIWCRRIAHSFRPCIAISDFADDLHHFYPRIFSHGQHILASLPGRTESQLLRDSLFRFVGCVVGQHQIREEIEQKRKRCLYRICLRIIVKIFYYPICLQHILFHQCVLQFDIVIILADSDVSLYFCLLYTSDAADE